jgi:hypothetical protein
MFNWSEYQMFKNIFIQNMIYLYTCSLQGQKGDPHNQGLGALLKHQIE